MYEYQANLIDIHDGDTLHMAIDLGCDVTLKMTIRLLGLNAPELATQAGKDALVYVREWFAAFPGPYLVQTFKDHKEKYGRYLATILAPSGRVLNADLLSSGHAVPYSGGAR